jgi:GNAT superfamily N-acetyltransferase
VSQEAVIRRATRSDRALVLRFHHELYIRFRDEVASAEVQPLFAYRDLERTLKEDVDGLLGGHDTIVLIAERPVGTPVGYVSGHIEMDLRRVLAKKGVVEDWYVLPEARGHGIGKLLLNTMIEKFKAADCEVAESGTWAFNAHARKAHAQAGFHEIEVKFRRKL